MLPVFIVVVVEVLPVPPPPSVVEQHTEFCISERSYGTVSLTPPPPLYDELIRPEKIEIN